MGHGLLALFQVCGGDEHKKSTQVFSFVYFFLLYASFIFEFELGKNYVLTLRKFSYA